LRKQHREYCAKWRRTHPDYVPKRNRAKERAAALAYQKANPDKARANAARYRARKRAQLCACCKAADFHAVYRAATLLCKEVDHSVPLHLGGLHCCKNLQLLTVGEHRQKTARENSTRMRAAAR
jgi:hypothetical protein